MVDLFFKILIRVAEFVIFAILLIFGVAFPFAGLYDQAILENGRDQRVDFSGEAIGDSIDVPTNISSLDGHIGLFGIVLGDRASFTSDSCRNALGETIGCSFVVDGPDRDWYRLSTSDDIFIRVVLASPIIEAPYSLQVWTAGNELLAPRIVGIILFVAFLYAVCGFEALFWWYQKKYNEEGVEVKSAFG